MLIGSTSGSGGGTTGARRARVTGAFFAAGFFAFAFAFAFAFIAGFFADFFAAAFLPPAFAFAFVFAAPFFAFAFFALAMRRTLHEVRLVGELFASATRLRWFCLFFVRALCIVVAGGIACRSPGPEHPAAGRYVGDCPPRGCEHDEGIPEVGWPCPGGLTPECLGLPATPEDDPPPAPQSPPPSAPGLAPPPPPITVADRFPPPPQARFYSHHECPPGRYGCVYSRTVTEDRVTDTVSCPKGGGYTGGHALRRLVATRFELVPTVDPDVPSAGLGIADIRTRINDKLDQFAACLRASTSSLQLDLEIAVAPGGGVISTRTTAHDPQCISDVLATITFPRSQFATRARWHFDFTVEDPNQYVKPLACP